MVLVFPEQIQQKMLFISITNIKLCFFAPCTRIYFCIVNTVITAWVVNYSAPILILKLNIRAYKQTKIFWQPKLTQLYRVCTLYFLHLACLPITNYFIKKVPCLEVQANSRIHTCAKGKVLFQSFICAVVSVIRFDQRVWFIRKTQTANRSTKIQWPFTARNSSFTMPSRLEKNIKWPTCW